MPAAPPVRPHWLEIREAEERQLALIAMAHSLAAAQRARPAPPPAAVPAPPAESQPIMDEQIRRLGLWRPVVENGPVTAAPLEKPKTRPRKPAAPR